MATLPAGTDRGTLVLVRTKEVPEGLTEPIEFVVGAGYLDAFSDEVDFVRFADESPEAADAREEKQAAAEAEAAKATKAPATSGSSNRGSDGFA